MKLVVYKDGSINLEESEKPQAKPGYAVIKVKACGFCGSDLSRLFSGEAHVYPLVVGHEFSGIVENSLQSELIGKRVCVFPILPCGKCCYCKNEDYANCLHYQYYGSREDGGMQDYLLVKQQNLIFLPDEVSYEEGAMVEPAAVCLHAILKAGDLKARTVVVFGAGTIGLLCAMWAKARGAKKVLISDIDDKRVEFFKKLGFEEMGRESADICIEASGSMSALEKAIESVVTFGTVVLVGNAPKDVTIKNKVYSQILRKQLQIKGSWNSDFKVIMNDWQDSIKAIVRKEIQPELLITHKFKLADSLKAVQLLKERREMYNKVMVEM